MRFLTECPRARNRMRIIGSIRRTLARENQPEDSSKGSCSRARSHLSDRGRSPRACHLFHSTVHDLERRVTGVCLSTRRDGIDLVAWTPLLNGRAQFDWNAVRSGTRYPRSRNNAVIRARGRRVEAGVQKFYREGKRVSPEIFRIVAPVFGTTWGHGY